MPTISEMDCRDLPHIWKESDVSLGVAQGWKAIDR